MHIALQIVLGCAVALVVYWVSLFVIRSDSLVIDSTIESNLREARVKIIDGYVDSARLHNREYSTINPFANNFTPLPRSQNRKGGAQFAYGFWIYIGDANTIRNKTLLLRGDSSTYKLDLRSGSGPTSITDFRVACPRIGFGNSIEEIIIEYNTLQLPIEKIVINPTKTLPTDTVQDPRNILRLLQYKWALMTFVFEDNVAINDFEDGISVRFYVNDLLYYTHTSRGTMRLNSGNLFTFPNSEPAAQCRIGDLTYYNYVPSLQTIRTTYEAGPPRHYGDAAYERAEMGDPLYLSEYNKLSIYG